MKVHLDRVKRQQQSYQDQGQGKAEAEALTAKL